MRDINFNNYASFNKKCIYISDVENKCIIKNKCLYSFADLSNNQDFRNFYVEPVFNDGAYNGCRLFEDYGIITNLITFISSNYKIENITEMLKTFEYSLYSGHKKYIEKKISEKLFINIQDIQLAEIMGEPDNYVENLKNLRKEHLNKKQEEKLKENQRKLKEEEELLNKNKNNIITSMESFENKVLHHEKIENYTVKIYYSVYSYDEKCIILCLLEKYKISIPPKTKGWINKSLVNIFYHESTDKWIYSYYGNGSKAFPKILNKLIISIKKQHNILTKEDKEIIEKIDKVGDYFNSIKDIVFKKHNNSIIEQAKISKQLKKGNTHIFNDEEILSLSERIYKNLNNDNPKKAAENYLFLVKLNATPIKEILIKSKCTSISLKALDYNGETQYFFIKKIENKNIFYMCKEVS